MFKIPLKIKKSFNESILDTTFLKNNPHKIIIKNNTLEILIINKKTSDLK